MNALIEILCLQQSYNILFYGKEANIQNIHNLILNVDFRAICTLTFQNHILPNFNIKYIPKYLSIFLSHTHTLIFNKK